MNSFPNSLKIEDLSKKLNRPEKFINDWFDRRRSSYNKKHGSMDGSDKLLRSGSGKSSADLESSEFDMKCQVWTSFEDTEGGITNNSRAKEISELFETNTDRVIECYEDRRVYMNSIPPVEDMRYVSSEHTLIIHQVVQTHLDVNIYFDSDISLASNLCEQLHVTSETLKKLCRRKRYKLKKKIGNEAFEKLVMSLK